MSKRFGSNYQYGERKKPKLNFTISDHNFPLSQNFNNNDNEKDHWGDDNDDEILLLASQACEEAYNDTSMLPDYSMCMQPESTSTQFVPTPSTSKTAFTFKKPSSQHPSSISTQLRNKCSTISSPLPGISSKVAPKQIEPHSLTDDLVFTDKICKGQDPDFMYKQLLQLQEENTKLKSENGKLLEKCVTKEGEASILRTQLKSSQVAVDNARLEKIKAQEKVQMEWNEKLVAANNQMHDLRTQLDFKNLEIISIKEKCKKLESSKVKLTQVMVSNNDISSHRLNNSLPTHEYTSQARRVKVSSSGAQTDDKAHFLKLNRISREEPSKLSSILPLVLEKSNEQQCSILDYNEKLQKHTDCAQSKLSVVNTFHRLPASTSTGRDTSKRKAKLSSIYEDLTFLATTDGVESAQERYFNIFNVLKSALLGVLSELEDISKQVTTAFLKEMDERYFEATADFLTMNKEQLLRHMPLFKEEQAIMTRRITTVTACILESPKSYEILHLYEKKHSENYSIIDNIKKICNLFKSNSCAVLYSGLLSSLVLLLEALLKISSENKTKVLNIVKDILASRPMPFVYCEVLRLMRRLSVYDECKSVLCPGTSAANLKVDYDQGVLLYKNDSCHFQILLKQVEVSLKCIENQGNTEAAVLATRNLLGVYSNVHDGNANGEQDKTKCDCQLMLLQIIVYALEICAVMLKKSKDTNTSRGKELLALCRSGIFVLYRCMLRDAEFSSQLSDYEGHLLCMCDVIKDFDHNETYGNMLSELLNTFKGPSEEISSFDREPWLKSFDALTMAE